MDNELESRHRAISTPSTASYGSAALELLSSTSGVEYADISELKTLALQRAMEGQGTPPQDGGVAGDRQVRRRRTRHDVLPEEREVAQPV